MRRLWRFLIIVFSVLVAFVVGCNIWVVTSSSDQIYDDLEKLPDHRVALVLGTSHRLAGGGSNPFFDHRIETAAQLYKLGKIDHFILSGDNSTQYYNEPVAMQKALLARGIPAEAITLDYAGLRTLDSVVRSKKIFGQDKITIITQPFHSYRAIFISNYYDMDAVAMVADEPGLGISFKVLLREYFARPKAVLDLYIFKTDPQFLGEKEQLNSQ
jgi:SanA protein